MNLNPNNFERTILDLERKRFGINKLDDITRPRKVSNENKYGRGPVKKAKYKDPAKDQLSLQSLGRSTYDQHRNLLNDTLENESNFSSNRSFDRYKTNLCYDKKYKGRSKQPYDTAESNYHSQSTPQLSSFRRAAHRTEYYAELNDDSDQPTNYDIERKLNILENSQDKLPKKKKKARFSESLVEEHKNFRDKIFDDPETESKIRKAFVTPKGTAETTEMSSSRSALGNRFQPISNRQININESHDTDKIGPNMRGLMYKELDKIRNDCRENNELLTKHISNNEEFYSKKFDELKNKLKNEAVTPNDVQSLVDRAVAQKLAAMHFEEESKKEHEKVSKVQAQINSLVNHYNTTDSEIKLLKDEIDGMHNIIEKMTRNHENEKRALQHRLDTIDKAITDVREDCIANSDSFIVNIESRLDEIDQTLRMNEKDHKHEVKRSSVTREPNPSEHMVNGLRKDIENTLRKINLRINDLEQHNSAHHKNTKELDNQIKSIKLSGKRDMKELWEKINEMGDQIDTTDMTVNKNINILQATPMNKTPTNSKAIENRVGRVETIVVRHGKLLDDLTANVNHLLEENKDQGKTKHCVWEEYTEDFANKIKSSFEQRILALEQALDDSDEMEFREQVFHEIDGIKHAAIQDIKGLDASIKALAYKYREPCHWNSHRKSNLSPRFRDTKKVQFTDEKDSTNKTHVNDSDLERADDQDDLLDKSAKKDTKAKPENKSMVKEMVKNDKSKSPRQTPADDKKSKNPKATQPGSSSIVVMNSQKNLDSKPNKGDVSDRSLAQEKSSPRSTSAKKPGATYSSPTRPYLSSSCCSRHNHGCCWAVAHGRPAPVTDVYIHEYDYPRDRQSSSMVRDVRYESSPQRSKRTRPLKKSKEKIKYSYDDEPRHH